MKKILFATLFWFLSLTWGLLMTVIGLLVTAFCIIFLKGKVHKNGFSYIVEIGGNWGGLNLGAVSLCGGIQLYARMKNGSSILEDMSSVMDYRIVY